MTFHSRAPTLCRTTESWQATFITWLLRQLTVFRDLLQPPWMAFIWTTQLRDITSILNYPRSKMPKAIPWSAAWIKLVLNSAKTWRSTSTNFYRRSNIFCSNPLSRHTLGSSMDSKVSTASNRQLLKWSSLYLVLIPRESGIGMKSTRSLWISPRTPWLKGAREIELSRRFTLISSNQQLRVRWQSLKVLFQRWIQLKKEIHRCLCTTWSSSVTLSILTIHSATWPTPSKIQVGLNQITI